MVSWLINGYPHAAYLVSWLGSFFIFFICYKGIIKKLPDDLPVFEQLLRPVFFLHLVFASYMACTSIFYYLNALGYEYFSYIGPRYLYQTDLYQKIANCQRYYVLGHAALVHGILAAMRYPQSSKYKVYAPSMSNLLLGISLFTLPLGFLFKKVGALSQFSVQLNGLSFVAGAIALAFAIREQKRMNLWASSILFLTNLYQALGSGYKEPIIVAVLLLGIFLLPVLGKKVIPVFGSMLLLLFFVLPTFIGNFRRVVSEGKDAATARDNSINNLINNDNLVSDLQEDNWAFLVGRFSEIDMFIRYTSSTPYFVPYYKTKIITDGFETIIPRFFWPEKPNVEQMVMDRVYKAGVVSQASIVSAKPAFVVDCYLSYGTLGIWLGLFAYGYLAQQLSQYSERLFGGYFLGSAVIFAGLFQIFWRGNSFEFLISSIFWSYVTMLIIFKFLRSRSILVEK